MKKQDFEIIFEDDNLIAVNKPSGLLSIPDRYDKTAPSLDRLLKDKYDEIYVVHRLDRDTSGVMLFAKDADTHRDLNIQFEKHTVKKIYHAVVSGIVPDDSIDIDIPLLPNPGKGGGVIPSARGKESLTILTVLERFRISTLVECNLITGRQHQLRVHVAAIGHPLLVDDLYNENKAFFLSSIKRKFNLAKNEEEQPIIKRITMHSKSVEFVHPKSLEKVVFECDYPKDFRVMLELLRKYAKVG